MIAFALIVSLSTLVAGVALALALRLLPTVRMQLAGLALLAVGLPLAAVILGGLVMFHMHDDVKILAVAAASASTALAAALLLGGQIARRIRGLEVAADELSCGELKARAPTEAPRELAHVGEAFNAMAGNIEALFDARRQLVAWASHDLRTPVASIQAMLEAVEDGLASIDEYLPALAPADAYACESDRRSVRARAHRRGRAHARAARGPAPAARLSLREAVWRPTRGRGRYAWRVSSTTPCPTFAALRSTCNACS